MLPSTDKELLKSIGYIGEYVRKKSGKPFKSGKKYNEIKNVIWHPITNRVSYQFYEDDSFVEAKQCEIVTKKRSWTLLGFVGDIWLFLKLKLSNTRT